MENWTRKFTRLQKAGFQEGVVQNPQLRTLCSYISILMCRSRKGDGWGVRPLWKRVQSYRAHYQDKQSKYEDNARENSLQLLKKLFIK